MKQSEIAILSAAYETKPAEQAKVRVLRAFLDTHHDMYSQNLVISDIWWAKNFEGMTAYLRELGIRQFILANTSTELMELLTFLLRNGYRVAGPATYGRKFDSSEDPARVGLLIEDLRIPDPDAL